MVFVSKLKLLALFSFLSLWSCSQKDNLTQENVDAADSVQTKSLSYLALGDSYTIGTSIGEENAYPHLLKAHLLKSDSISSVALKVIAQNGWTTQNLLDGISHEQPDSTYDLVSLLIGVNNQYQGRDKLEYAQQFSQLLKQSIAFAEGDTSRVVVISIPDWGATPSGASGRQSIAEDIDDFNEINRSITSSLGVTYVDVAPVSRTAIENSDLVAQDQLHFSGKMHELWLDLIAPKVEALLTRGN